MMLWFGGLHLMVTEIQPGQTFSRHAPPIRTPWVKTIPRQPLEMYACSLYSNIWKP